MASLGLAVGLVSGAANVKTSESLRLAADPKVYAAPRPSASWPFSVSPRGCSVSQCRRGGVGVVGVVDFGWCCAVGPGQAAGVGDGGLVVAVGDRRLSVGGTGEEQCVGVRGATVGPVGVWWTSL